MNNSLNHIVRFAFFCVCFFLQTTYTHLWAQSTKVSLFLEQASLRKVFDEIEKKTDYLFVFSGEDVDIQQKVTINAQNKPVSEILNEVLKKAKLRYILEGKNIMILSQHGQQKEDSDAMQSVTIKGVVKDVNDDPIVGANIVIEGTTMGTITNIDGDFTLEVPVGARLHITFIGYQAQIISVGNRRSLDIVLKEDASMLDEVVVVGYGTMKKKDLTGAMTAVKGDDIAARRTTQLSSSLQGMMSGVTVSRNNGAPGAKASIQVRGVTTIGDTSPLVIIDGIPGDIDQVNPEDVESMSVLKDAASASIYGSRAAAGVIVITTKRAKKGDMAMSYNFEYGWELPTKLPTYVGAIRYMEMLNETRYNDNPDGGRFQTYPENLINSWVTNNMTDPDNYPITNWKDVLLKS